MAKKKAKKSVEVEPKDESLEVQEPVEAKPKKAKQESNDLRKFNKFK